MMTMMIASVFVQCRRTGCENPLPHSLPSLFANSIWITFNSVLTLSLVDSA